MAPVGMMGMMGRLGKNEGGVVGRGCGWAGRQDAWDWWEGQGTWATRGPPGLTEQMDDSVKREGGLVEGGWSLDGGGW